MNKYTKKELFRHFKNSCFPNDKITKDALNLKEFLFESESNKNFIDETMIYGDKTLIENNKKLSESFYDLNDSMLEKNKYQNKIYKKDNKLRKNIKNNEKDTNDFSNQINNNKNFQNDTYKNFEYSKNTYKHSNYEKYNKDTNLYSDKGEKNKIHLDITSNHFSFILKEKNFNGKELKNSKIIDYDPNNSENEKLIEKFTKNNNRKSNKKKLEHETLDESNVSGKKEFIFNKNTNKIFNEKVRDEISQGELLLEDKINEDNSNQNFIDEVIKVDAEEISEINYMKFPKNNFNEKNFHSKNNDLKINFTGNINFKKIYEINKQLKYPETKPFWYINHPEAKSSYGPLSTKQLEVMYSKKEINEFTKIRFIDLIKFKNKSNFDFITIKELESPEILSEIEMSNLYKSLFSELSSIKVIEVKSLLKGNTVINSLNSKNKNLAPKNDVKKSNKKIKEISEPLDLPKYDKSLFEFKKENQNYSNKNTNIIENKNLKNYNLTKSEEVDYNEENASNDNIKDIHNLINQQLKNVFDDEDDNNNIFDSKKELVNIFKKNLDNNIKNLDEKHNIENEIEKNFNKDDKQANIGIIKKNNKKRAKAQKVNIDVKTGFYTLTEQEIVYDPIYIVGDHK